MNGHSGPRGAPLLVWPEGEGVGVGGGGTWAGDSGRCVLFYSWRLFVHTSPFVRHCVRGVGPDDIQTGSDVMASTGHVIGQPSGGAKHFISNVKCLSAAAEGQNNVMGPCLHWMTRKGKCGNAQPKANMQFYAFKTH